MAPVGCRWNLSDEGTLVSSPKHFGRDSVNWQNMVAKAELQDSGNDKILLAAAALVGIAGLVAFYALPIESLLVKVLMLLVVAALVIALFYMTGRGKRTAVFFRDARTEVRKVVWPTRAETVQTTLTVAVLVILVGLFLWLLDSILSYLFRLLTGI